MPVTICSRICLSFWCLKIKRCNFPYSLVVCDSWSLTMREECKFKNSVLRKIPGTKRKKATADRASGLLLSTAIPQLVKKLAIFSSTWGFITVFTTAPHLSLSWARLSQSMPSCPISFFKMFYIYIHTHIYIPFHLCLDLPSSPFFQVSPPKPQLHFSFPSNTPHVLPISSSLISSP